MNARVSLKFKFPQVQVPSSSGDPPLHWIHVNARVSLNTCQCKSVPQILGTLHCIALHCYKLFFVLSWSLFACSFFCARGWHVHSLFALPPIDASSPSCSLFQPRRLAWGFFFPELLYAGAPPVLSEFPRTLIFLRLFLLCLSSPNLMLFMSFPNLMHNLPIHLNVFTPKPSHLSLPIGFWAFATSQERFCCAFCSSCLMMLALLWVRFRWRFWQQATCLTQ